MATSDKRLSVIGAAIRLELQRPQLLAMANGDADALNHHIRMAIAQHKIELTKPPLL